MKSNRGVKPGTKRGTYNKTKPETTTINFRVPVDKAEPAKDYLRPLLKEYLKNV